MLLLVNSNIMQWIYRQLGSVFMASFQKHKTFRLGSDNGQKYKILTDTDSIIQRSVCIKIHLNVECIKCRMSACR